MLSTLGHQAHAAQCDDQLRRAAQQRTASAAKRDSPGREARLLRLVDAIGQGVTRAPGCLSRRARVSQAFQRARWRGGRAVVWLGAHKTTGRGEGSSGLAFDRLVDSPDQRPTA